MGVRGGGQGHGEAGVRAAKVKGEKASTGLILESLDRHIAHQPWVI